MNDDVKAVVRECAAASDEERISFPQVVARLAAVGVERYHADLMRHEKTFYLPDGPSELVIGATLGGRAAETFEADGVESAVRSIQKGEIGYRAFCERIMDAGCVGYMVTLAGRRAIYYGRSGDCYIERFPSVS